MKIIVGSAAQTAGLARKFAKTLKGGEVIGLVGNLGAGKTTFIQALSKALGVKERVTSPTFVYFHEHRLKKGPIKTLVHADAYRADARTLRGIGLEEYFGDPGTVVLIEWADRAKEIMPRDALRIRFVHLKGDRRRIELPGLPKS